MKEYFTEALVLDKEPYGEFDARIFLYTEKLGRVSAKVTSGRKITSKLNPHLEPLNLVKIRLASRNGSNGFQVADVIRFGKLGLESLPVLKFLKQAILENHADPRLWTHIKSEKISASEILKILGFDPAFASCVNCGAKKPEYFHFKDSEYYCENCAPKTLSFVAKINF